MLNIIALTGHKGSGKTTAAEYLGQNRNDVVHASFAAPIKSMLSELYYCVTDNAHAYLWGSKKEEELPIIGKTSRHIMQTLGTEWGHKYLGEDIWAKVLLADIENNLKGEDFSLVIIDDMRFISEYTYLAARSKLMVINLLRGDRPVDGHVSEQQYEQIPVDCVINNNGTKEELFAALTDAIDNFPWGA